LIGLEFGSNIGALIGRSPLSLFDPLKDDVLPLKLGQRVKFQRISKKDFDGFTPN